MESKQDMHFMLSLPVTILEPANGLIPTSDSSAAPCSYWFPFLLSVQWTPGHSTQTSPTRVLIPSALAFSHMSNPNVRLIHLFVLSRFSPYRTNNCVD